MKGSDEFALSIETWVTHVEQSLWTLVEVGFSTTIPPLLSKTKTMSRKAEAKVEVKREHARLKDEGASAENASQRLHVRAS